MTSWNPLHRLLQRLDVQPTERSPGGVDPAGATMTGPLPGTLARSPDRFRPWTPPVVPLLPELRPPDTSWWRGRPLSEGLNAHETNTVEEFEDALASDANWFEGDIRVELDHDDRLEMRHDTGHEDGDNLTLDQWLTMGRDSGRGLKLDIKETDLMPQLLDQVERAGIPDERLMFNLQDGDMTEWGAEIRRRFPDAYLALNPPSELDGEENDDGPMEPWQLDRMTALAEQLGGPVCFVIEQDRITQEAVDRLQAHGPVSIWGKGVEDVEARTGELRRMGVAGIIDVSG